MPEVVQGAEGHVQQAPLLVVLIVEAGLGDGGHEDGPTVWGGGQPGSPIIMPQPLCSSDGGKGLLVLAVDTSLLVRFPEVRQQGHGLWAPGRGHVLLHALLEVISPGHRQAAKAPAGEALAEEVGTELQPHFRFEWLVLGEDSSSQGVVGGDIIQPVGLEGIRKVGHVAGHVAEQHATAYMAFQTCQDVACMPACPSRRTRGGASGGALRSGPKRSKLPCGATHYPSKRSGCFAQSAPSVRCPKGCGHKQPETRAGSPGA